ncbi:WD40-repeat-containing domain protein [Dimargaris cristalligena]|uniref:Ribosome biogenesis protein NSA1 n=1 Tax=Dimargaris cristalligena TaxID=215637 RepID=A0A4P9ZY28_9FUNG|nr:WD40-repeat-containing domain protein [Dimargaris cristalligena]|eukprot:RKP37660.1 WD40-repeat-containing domain protein [Dimargaris cristalligena]
MAIPLRCYTGDESGLLKSVTLSLTRANFEDIEGDSHVGVTRRHMRMGIRSQVKVAAAVAATNGNDATATIPSMVAAPADPNLAIVRPFSTKVDRARAIQKVHWLEGAGASDPRLLVARVNGDIDLVSTSAWAGGDAETTTPTQYQSRHQSLFDRNAELQRTKPREVVNFVGLWGTPDGTTAYGTSTGKFRIQTGPFQPATEEDQAAAATTTTTGTDLRVGFNTPMNRLRIHPRQNHIVAYLGKERQLTLWDVNQLSGAVPGATDSANAWAKPTGDPLFFAKNVPRDFLDLWVPFNGTDFAFMDDSASSYVLATEDKQVRIYDTRTGRDTVHDFEHGKEPLRHILMAPDNFRLFTADNRGNVLSMDIRTGRELTRVPGPAGAVQSMAIDPQIPQYLITVGSDRHLRVNDISTPQHPLVTSVYLKQRLSQVVIDTAWVTSALVESARTSSRSTRKMASAAAAAAVAEEDDELWNKMTKVTSKSEQRKRQKTSKSSK